MSERTMLMQLAEPADGIEPNWKDALQRAGYRGRHVTRYRQVLRPRWVLLFVAVAAAVLYSVPAVAQGRWWWVGASGGELQPATQVLNVGRWKTEQLMIDPNGGSVPTASFARDGDQWIVQTFLNKEGNLCVGISPDPPRPANEGAAIGCGYPVRGLPLSYTPDEQHWVGFTAGIPGKVTNRAPKFMYGPAAERVHTVDLEDHLNERVLRVRTIALPRELGIRVRLWIVVLPVDQLVHTIVPRDKDGNALEHWQLPTAQ